jgi:hypothetical protein
MRVAVKTSDAMAACAKAIAWYQNYPIKYKEFFIDLCLNIGSYTTYKFLWFGRKDVPIYTRKQAEQLLDNWKIRYKPDGVTLQIVPATKDMFYDDCMAAMIRMREHFNREAIMKLDRQLLTLSASSLKSCCLSDDENHIFLNYLTGFDPPYNFRKM